MRASVEGEAGNEGSRPSGRCESKLATRTPSPLPCDAAYQGERSLVKQKRNSEDPED